MLEKFFSNQVNHLVCSAKTNLQEKFSSFFLNLDETLSCKLSHFNQYFYFLFAPTLIYRDSYPRTASIQWNIVFNMFGQFIIIFFLFYNVVVYYWVPVFEPFFTKDEITLEFSVSSIFDLMIPAVLAVILGNISDPLI